MKGEGENLSRRTETKPATDGRRMKFEGGRMKGNRNRAE
jgi:hypothetical protein